MTFARINHFKVAAKAPSPSVFGDAPLHNLNSRANISHQPHQPSQAAPSQSRHSAPPPAEISPLTAQRLGQQRIIQTRMPHASSAAAQQIPSARPPKPQNMP